MDGEAPRVADDGENVAGVGGFDVGEGSLQADLRAVLEWAEAHGRRWAFSDRNAGAHLANFFKRIEDLEEVNWDAVASTDFRDSFVKEGKQAEFLMHGSLPWELIERIGVVSAGIQAQVVATIGSGGSAGKKPLVSVEPGWYY